MAKILADGVLRDETDAERQRRVMVASHEASKRTAAILRQRRGLQLLDKTEDNEIWQIALKAPWLLT